MNAFNVTAALNDFAARKGEAYLNSLSQVEEISPAALAFARQLNAVSLFLEALSIGNDSKLNGAL